MNVQSLSKEFVEFQEPALQPLPSRRQVRMRMYSLLLVADLIAFYAALGVAATLSGFWSHSFDWEAVAFAALPIYVASATNLRAYAVDALQYPAKGRSRALIAATFTLLVLLLVGYFLDSAEQNERTGLAIALFLVPAAVVAARLGVGAIGANVFDDWYVTELVITDGEEVPIPPHAIVIDACDAGLKPDLRNPMMLHRLAQALNGVDRVVIACPPEAQRDWAMSLKGANIRGEVLAREFEAVSAIGIDQICGRSTMMVASGPLGLSNRILKRGLDLALTIPALVILAPVLLIVALAIKIDSPGPVLFRQPRVGRANALFTVYKFRSMRVEACDADGARSTHWEDARVTRIGRFIRRTSIDELPQLFNVLLGSMSLVGPRPHALGSLAGQQLFWEVDERYWHRHALKPGITGLAQVRGFRGTTHRRDDLTRRLQADLEYISGWTIWRDLLILMKTALVVVHPNAY